MSVCFSFVFFLDQCFDGSCVSSYQSCPHADCQLLGEELGLDVPLTTCWNGECLVEGACPPLPACPSEWPVRCQDGSCQTSADLCNVSPIEVIICPAGTSLCLTGECLAECPAVNGCGMNEGMCSNGVCVQLISSDFTGVTSFLDRCPSSCRAGGVSELME